MKYTLLIKRRAKKVLQSLSRTDRSRITEKIVLLGKNPNDSELNIRPLEGQSSYRLRVGDWRIIYDRDDDIRVIAIEKIKPRGDVYK